MSETQYFAAKPAEQTADTLLSRANAWYNQLYSNGYLTKVKDMWMAYHGCYYTGPGSSHKISFGGEQGELVNLAVNHIRNLAQHMLVMITAQRPTMTARATNSDYKSVVQVKLAEGLLDYYMREKRLEKYLRTATEYAIVFGSGYIKMSWNATSGEIYEISEETGVPVYEGDVEFRNLSPFDVVFDMSKETAYEQDWVMTRTFKNKFDIAAKFPELAEKIKGLQTKSDLFRYRMDLMGYDDTDDVPVYEFYHKRTESMPDGRYLLFLDTNIVLMDTPMPYRNLPVYRIAPQEILGTPFGYTPMFDLLPIQDSINSLYSTILTNQHAFGIQNIYIPRGAEVSLKSLEGGLNIIEGSGDAKPEALNLTQTPREIFEFVQMLERLMETISGINSVARGNPEASLKSGAALALVQSQALQFMSGLQQQYVQLVEDIGTGLIDMLKDFAAVPRIAMIVGKSNSSYVQREFTGEELNQVNRIIVDMGNALSKTTAGKMQLAEQMMQYGIVKNAEDVISVMETGRLDVMTDETYRELMLIRQENEALAEGEEVRVLGIDKHLQHINHHKAILSDPRLRMDDELTRRVLQHIQEHINELRNFDPALLALIGEQPLGPVGGSPPSVQADPSAPPPQAAMAPEQGPMGPPPGPGDLPNMPSMPQVDANMLPNPELQANVMGNVAE